MVFHLIVLEFQSSPDLVCGITLLGTGINLSQTQELSGTRTFDVIFGCIIF